MAAIKAEHSRGRSPGPAADRRASVDNDVEDHDSPAPASNDGAPVRTSKRRKRSELSPSSKATHSIIEKERREAMNEKFSELAANIPELVEAMAAGKRPTKGEIVKASISRHQEQERRVRELMHEVQMLRSRSATPSNYAVDSPAPLTAPAAEPVAQAAQTLAMPYQIQSSHPIGVPASQDNLWIGQLLHKTGEPLAMSAEHPPLSLLPDLAQPISPFKQTSMMNWSMSALPQPLDASTLTVGFATSSFAKGLTDGSGTLEYLGRRNSLMGGMTSTSGFSSPTFTSSDSDSSFGTDALDTSLDDRKFFADGMSFEPFAMPSAVVEQTPLSSLVGLPSTEHASTAPTGGADKKPRARTNSRRARLDESTRTESSIWNSPLPSACLPATS
ncbi:hypothetical protein PaG_05752 [Moesziomyces aphidis]|jgi:hypothetical protein|uniref:BHLH domain-containing protein n=1 Tax=Moesziomyces aphidis TaxID=84754 RepID=W3VFA0_MOEAP|nr:hypothetical protein PaG_05752 [Moesziomyces aphidis]